MHVKRSSRKETLNLFLKYLFPLAILFVQLFILRALHFRESVIFHSCRLFIFCPYFVRTLRFHIDTIRLNLVYNCLAGLGTFVLSKSPVTCDIRLSERPKQFF